MRLEETETDLSAETVPLEKSQYPSLACTTSKVREECPEASHLPEVFGSRAFTVNAALGENNLMRTEFPCPDYPYVRL